MAGGRGWNHDKLWSLIADAEQIIYTDYISEADKNALYRNAAAFAFPSIYEGFGIPILEAFYHGVPVVASNTASIPEVAGDAYIAVNPYDVCSIADGLSRALTQDASIQGMVERGRKRLEQFSWDASTNRLLDIYRSFI